MAVENYNFEQTWCGFSSDLTTCREKESVLQVENNQFINLTETSRHSGCELVNASEYFPDHKLVQCKVKPQNLKNEAFYFALYAAYFFSIHRGPETSIQLETDGGSWLSPIATRPTVWGWTTDSSWPMENATTYSTTTSQQVYSLTTFSCIKFHPQKALRFTNTVKAPFSGRFGHQTFIR